MPGFFWPPSPSSGPLCHAQPRTPLPAHAREPRAPALMGVFQCANSSSLIERRAAPSRAELAKALAGSEAPTHHACVRLRGMLRSHRACIIIKAISTCPGNKDLSG